MVAAWGRALLPLRSGLARNSMWALAGTGISTGALFLETIILARYLGLESLGVFFLIVAYPEAVQQFLDFRVRDVMTRYLGFFVAREQRDRAVALVKLLWWADVAASLFGFVLVFATAGLAAHLFLHAPEREALIIVYASGLIVGSLDSASGTVLRVLNRFGLAFAASAASSGARLALVIAVVLADKGLSGVVLARVGAEVLTTLVLGGTTLYTLRQQFAGQLRTPIGVLRDQYREIWQFSITTNLTGAFRLASTRLDTLLVGALTTPAVVAVYRVAIQFGRAPLLLSDSLLTAVYPRFSRAVAQGRVDDLRRVARGATTVLACTILPAALAAATAGGWVMSTLAGEQFRSAGTPFAITVISVTVYSVLFWVYPLLLATGNARDLLQATAGSALAQLGSVIVFVPALGATGAAIAFAIGSTSSVALQLYFVRRRRLLAGEPPGPAQGLSGRIELVEGSDERDRQGRRPD